MLETARGEMMRVSNLPFEDDDDDDDVRFGS